MYTLFIMEYIEKLDKCYSDNINDYFIDIHDIQNIDNTYDDSDDNNDARINSTSNGECKIFVGNVPYQCTQDEFEKCFKDVDGFKKAEIITAYKSNVSRGFGFITMQSSLHAEKLKNRDDIVFKNRILRFTPYQTDSVKIVTDNYINNINNSNKNYVFVDKIPKGYDREWLKSAFSNYEPIGKYFISTNYETGVHKHNGLLEILDDSKYKQILEKKYHTIVTPLKKTMYNQNDKHDEKYVILEISRYKIRLHNKYCKQNKHINTSINGDPGISVNINVDVNGDINGDGDVIIGHK